MGNGRKHQEVVKKRGRRQQKIVNVDTNMKKKPSRNTNVSAVILKMPFDKMMCPNVEDTENDVINEPPEMENSIDDMFDTGECTVKKCSKCEENKQLLDDALKKLSKHEKIERDERSNKIHVNEPKYISLKTNKKIRIKKTKNRCRWDGHTFKNTPCFLPEYYQGGKYHVTRCFCSFNCALAFNLYYIKDSRVDERKSLVHQLYREIYDIPDDEPVKIPIAAEVDILESYGGDMSIEDYRKNFSNIDKSFAVIIPPVKPISVYIEERLGNAILPFSNDYILKRSKPLETKNSIFKTINRSKKQ